jgi:Zn-finger nucleic acid-binding protein
MEVVRFEAIDVDRCVRCGGLWFDRREAEELRGRRGSEVIDSGPAWQAPMHNEQGKVSCPVDGTLMVRVIDRAYPQIRLESCPRCQGTFFDAGEFTGLKEHELGELLQRRRSGDAP